MDINKCRATSDARTIEMRETCTIVHVQFSNKNRGAPRAVVGLNRFSIYLLKWEMMSKPRRKWWRGNFYLLCVHVTSTPFGSYCLLLALLYTSRISFLTLNWTSVFIYTQCWMRGEGGIYRVNTHVFDSIWDILLIFLFSFSYLQSIENRAESWKEGRQKLFSLLARLLHTHRERELYFLSESSLFSSLHLDNLSPHWGEKKKETNEKEYTLSKVQPSDVYSPLTYSFLDVYTIPQQLDGNIICSFFNEQANFQSLT